jgi:drug/metabolite transporter (DMT)-like permease
MTGGHMALKARFGIILAAAAGLMLAINDVSVPFSYAQGFSPPTVVFARYAFLLAVLFILLPALGLRPRLGRTHMRHALGSGIAAAIATLGLLGSFAYIPVSLGIVILYTFPMLTALLECLHARRLPSAIELSCLIAAFAGVGIAVGLNEFELAPMGLLLALIAAVGYAGSIFWNAIKLRDADGTVVTFHMAIAGVVTVFLYLAATGSFRVTSQPGLTPWLALFITCFFFSIAFVLMFKAVECAGGAPTAMMLNLEPVFVIALAALLLDEKLTLPRILGSALVIGGVVVSEIARSRQNRRFLVFTSKK